LLTEWNLDFDFDAEYPLRKIDADYNESQVRLPDHRAPSDTVTEFTTQMGGQLQLGRLTFPPLVLTHNGRLIDGNTRKAAAEQNGLETFPVYLVRLPRPDHGLMIGAALNQMGGKRLTAEEAFAAAEKMMRENYADEAIARTLGRSVQSVRNYRRERRYHDAADRTGVTSLTIGRQAQRHLADINHDEPFKAAAQLVAATKVAPKDVQELVGKVSSARSEREEIEIVDEYRKKWKPSGPPPQRTAPNKAALAAARKVDAVLAIVAPAAELAPTALRGDLEPKWRKLRDLADQVIAAFAEAPETEVEAAQAS
jgi:ParB-like chromosome segregation protein Spo0J